MTQIYRCHGPRSEPDCPRTLTIDYVNSARSVVEVDMLINEDKVLVQQVAVEIRLDEVV